MTQISKKDTKNLWNYQRCYRDSSSTGKRNHRL